MAIRARPALRGGTFFANSNGYPIEHVLCGLGAVSRFVQAERAL